MLQTLRNHRILSFENDLIGWSGSTIVPGRSVAALTCTLPIPALGERSWPSGFRSLCSE